MHLLAEADASQVTPAMMGMVVIILMQLAQFFFAWRKDMRGTESAKKEDLATLRSELLGEIKEVSCDVDDMKKSIENKMEDSRKESSRARGDIYGQIRDGALKTAALIESTDTLKQTLISLGMKFDALRVSNNTLTNSHRKAP